MKSREYYEKKIRKKITKIFKKTIKRKYKQETKKGKITSFTYKEIEIESAHQGNLYFFSVHKELLLDCFIEALKELNDYNFDFNTNTNSFIMERRSKQ